MTKLLTPTKMNENSFRPPKILRKKSNKKNKHHKNYFHLVPHFFNEFTPFIYMNPEEEHSFYIEEITKLFEEKEILSEIDPSEINLDPLEWDSILEEKEKQQQENESWEKVIDWVLNTSYDNIESNV